MPEPKDNTALSADRTRLDELILSLTTLEATLKQRLQQADVVAEEITELMLKWGFERYVGKNGEALLTASSASDWNIKKLEATLTKKLFDTYCPRKPDGGALTKYRQSIAANEPLCRALDKCREIKLNEKLSVVPADDVAKRAKPVTTSMMDMVKLSSIIATRKTRAAKKKAVADALKKKRAV